MKMNSKISSKHKDYLVCGIDEAGRGSVLGPLVICGVCVKQEDLVKIKDVGAKDSKKLNAEKREKLAFEIKNICNSYDVIAITPKEIDNRGKKRITLNHLEELKMADIINKLRPDIIYLDAADVNEIRFGKSIGKLLEYTPKKIISKHKADDIYPIVGAASIIAKDTRDSMIEKLKTKYGEIGSGYPSDSKTTDFLRMWIRKYKKAPLFARCSWDTTKRILTEEVYTRKLTEFF